MTPGGFTTPECGADEPEDGEDHGGDPEEVDGETQAGEEDHDKEDEQEDHVSTVPNSPTNQTAIGYRPITSAP
jgi:hypothetical protein